MDLRAEDGEAERWKSGVGIMIKLKTITCAAVIAALATGTAAHAQDTKHMDFHPSMSPDGQRLVYYAYRGAGAPDLYVLDMQTGEEQVLAPTLRGWEIEPTWSPIDNRIAFARGATMGELHTITHDLDTGEELDFGPGVNPSWSPDGQWMAWQFDHGIRIADRETGQARNLDFSSIGGEQSEPVWGHDGRYLIFMQKDGDDFELSRIELETGAIRTLTDSGFPKSPAHVTADGRRLLVAAAMPGLPERIYYMALDGEAEMEPVGEHSGSQRHYFPSLSPDETSLIYEAGDWGSQSFFIYLADLDGDDGENRQVTQR